MNNNDFVLRTTNLTKKYDSKIAVNNLNLTIKKGDIYGFIGKNGAGKTTLMKMVVGLTLPTTGEIELFGEPSNLDKCRKRVGSLIEEPGLYKNCTAFENMKRFAILYNASDDEIYNLLKAVGLENVKEKTVGNFSLGMRQRLGIAIAMLGNPEFLVLDEPINGLDPEAIKDIRDTILRFNKERGVTFLIASHLLSELTKIATVYGVITNGILVEEIRTEDLKEYCTSYLKITVDDVEKALQILKDDLLIESYKIDGNIITIYEKTELSGLINTMLVTQGIRVSELSIKRKGEEEFFIERMGSDEPIN